MVRICERFREQRFGIRRGGQDDMRGEYGPDDRLETIHANWLPYGVHDRPPVEMQ